MLSGSSLVVFAAATMLLLVVPGPAVLYIVTRSAAQGRRAGVVSVLGIHTGTLVHVAAALVGLSAVVATSAAAFTVVKLAGAGYLLWLGVQALRSGGHDDAGDVAVPARSLRRVYVDGLVLNVLNPKTAIFFLAFVPQFVDPDAGSATTQLLELGATFIVLGLLSDGAYALLGSAVGGLLRRSPRAARRVRRGSAGVYLGLGAVTALSGGSGS